MARVSLFFVISLTVAVAVYISTNLLKTSDFQELISHGDKAVQENEISLAIEHFSGALALNGQSMVAYLKRGAADKGGGDLNAALRDTTIAVQ